MKTKETSSSSTPIFRIRIFDAVVDVPVKHDRVERPRIEDTKEPDLFHQPEYSPSLSSPNNDDSNNSFTHNPSTNDRTHTISPLSCTSRFQDDFLALLTLLPVERCPPSPSSPTFSFCSADYFDHDKGGVERGKDNPSNTSSSSKEDSSQIMLENKELGVILTTEKTQS